MSFCEGLEYLQTLLWEPTPTNTKETILFEDLPSLGLTYIFDELVPRKTGN
jgi:hypothetical protein